MQLYGISFMHPNKQSGRWLDMLDTTYSTVQKTKTTYKPTLRETQTQIYQIYEPTPETQLQK
jgi:hypothetical protein